MTLTERLEAFGKLLTRRAHELDKTISDLGRELDVKIPTVYKWHNDEMFPTEDKLIFIAWHYRIGLDELTKVWKISLRVTCAGGMSFLTTKFLPARDWRLIRPALWR